MNRDEIRVNFSQLGSGIMVPNALKLKDADLYKLRMDTNKKKRVDLITAQDDAALRYQILTGDVDVIR